MATRTTNPCPLCEQSVDQPAPVIVTSENGPQCQVCGLLTPDNPVTGLGLSGEEFQSNKDIPFGYPGLDANSRIQTARLPFAAVTAAAIGGVPAWAATTHYGLNDLVSNASTIYLCTTDHTSTSTFDPTKFQAISLLSALPFNYMPPPSGSATTDAANFSTAIAKGGIVVMQAAPSTGPYLLPNSAITIPDGCGLVGQGNPTDSTNGTWIKATGASSSLIVNGSGPMIGHFELDGAGLANFPLQIGTVATDGGGQRVYVDLAVANALLDGVTILYTQNLTWIGGTIEGSKRDGLHFDGGTGGHQFIGLEIIGGGATSRYGVYMSANIIPASSLGLFDQPSRISFYGGRSEPDGVAGLLIDNAFGCTFDNFDLVGTGNFVWAAVAAITSVHHSPPGLYSTSHVFRDVGFSGAASTNNALFIDNNCSATIDGECNDYTGNGININTGAVARLIAATRINGATVHPFPT